MPNIHLQVRNGSSEQWKTLNVETHDGSDDSRFDAIQTLRAYRTEWENNVEELRSSQFRLISEENIK